MSEPEQIFDNIRGWGYPQEDLDPLGSLQLEYVSELDPDREESKLDPNYRCRTIGVELIHLPDGDRRNRIQKKIECQHLSFA